MQYKVKINGVDFSPYLRENGVTEYTIERNAKSVVTLDGMMLRGAVKKTGLRIQLITMRDKLMEKVEAALTSPAKVQYTARDGSEKEGIFYVASVTANVRKVSGGITYWTGASFILEEK